MMQNNIEPWLLTDSYKLSHAAAYDKDIFRVSSYMCNRSNKFSNTDLNGTIFFGMQYFLKSYMQNWQDNFFLKNKKEVIKEIKLKLSIHLGYEYDTSHFEALHDLGYLPLQIRALPEGTFVPYKVPYITIINTHENFAWLTNYIETALSAYIWPMSTSATTAFAYKLELMKANNKTGNSISDGDLTLMCHDFSMRGMFGTEAAAMSGLGHLTSFMGSDSLPSLSLARRYYDSTLSAFSVPATEHSTATSYILSKGGDRLESEIEYNNYLMDQFPTGIVSSVFDSFDFWGMVEHGLPKLKDRILSRNGTFVIRPDSGDPVDIICGTKENGTTYEEKGLIESLWDLFGGTTNDAGYKLLNPKIGAIYGDSITLERQKLIYEKLIAKGFVPSVVLGVGSYSYQYVTRDTHSSAIKCTQVAVIENGKFKHVPVYKDPKTDSGKKSAKGRVDTVLHNGELTLVDDNNRNEISPAVSALNGVFFDGKMYHETSLSDVRNKVNAEAVKQLSV